MHYLKCVHKKVQILHKIQLKHAALNQERTHIKKHPQYLVFSYTRLNIVFLCSGIVALIEAPTQLQVVEPHLQECVDVACCTQVGQANKCVLERGRDRTRDGDRDIEREGERKRERKRERERGSTVSLDILPSLAL